MRGAARVTVFLLALQSALAAPVQADDKPRFDVGFQFSGNETLSSIELEREVRALRVEIARQGMDEAWAEDVAYELERYYQERGFPDVGLAIAWRRDKAAITVEVRIREGRRTFLGRVTFSGNETVSAADLERCFEWRRTTFLGAELVLGQRIFTPTALNAGVRCTIDKLQFEGFFFADARAETRPGEQPDTIDVQVIVDEGAPVELAQPVELRGVAALDESTIRAVLGLAAEEVYTPLLPLVLKGRILELYRRMGFLYASVDADRDIRPGELRALVSFTIHEGVRVTVDDVRIQGNEQTYDWVIHQRLRLGAGDLYDEDRIRESYRSLIRSGLFATVRIEPVPVGSMDAVEEGISPELRGGGVTAPEPRQEPEPVEADRVTLRVDVREKDPYRLSVLAGWGSYELLRGKVTFEHINFLGTGHRLRTEGFGSLKGEGGLVGYLIPYVFRDDLSQDFEVQYSRREHPAFEEIETGGHATLIYRMTDEVRTSFGYRLRDSRTQDVSPDVPAELVEDVLISSLEWSTVLEYRASVLDPREGSTHRLTAEYGTPTLGSELHFVKLFFQTTWVIPLWWELLVVPSVRIGVIPPLGSSANIPVQERFYLGGESTIRSYTQFEAGPKSGGKPIGGEASMLYNLELRFPVFGDLHGTVFFDAGTLAAEVQDIGSGRYYLGVGAGLRYVTPVGPFRVDVGFNPDREDDEDLFVVHFSLGYPF